MPPESPPGDDARVRFFAPCVLAPFADDLAGRLSRLDAGPVLEIMADIGTLTQAMAASMAAGTSIIATDPDAARLEHAAARPGTAGVVWRPADLRSLPFADASFATVTCLFGLATTPHRGAAFAEVRRVLQPNGRFLFTVPAKLAQTPVADCVQQALTALFPDDPPRYLPSVLHSYGEPEVIDDDLTEAGFTEATYAVIEAPFSARAASDAAAGYCLGTPLRAEIEARAGGDIRPAVEAVVAALRRQFGDGPIRATMRAAVVSAA